MKYQLDSVDRALVSVVTEDGQMSAGKVAERLDVTSPTVRSRMRNLLRKGVLRISGLVDPFRMKGITIALVCLTVQSHELLGQKLEQISELDKVTWAGIVTGRYDIIAEIVLSEEISDLYRFLDEDLSKIGGISSSESFVLMQGKRKWTLLPKGVRKRMGI